MAEDSVMNALSTVNNFVQGFVDLIPGGRTIVDGAHGAQNWASGENYDYNALTDKTSLSYAGGQVTGIGWNVVTGRALIAGMVAKAPVLATSSVPYIARLGNLIQTTRSIKNIDNARNAMETARCLMYSFRFYKNWQRMKAGKITRQQFDSMNSKDILNYQMGATVWAIPGTYGLWIAAGNLIFGTITSEMKMDTVLQGKK